MPVGSPPTGVHLERPCARKDELWSRMALLVMFCHGVLAARLAEWFRLHPRPPAAQPARSHSTLGGWSSFWRASLACFLVCFRGGGDPPAAAACAWGHAAARSTCLRGAEHRRAGEASASCTGVALLAESENHFLSSLAGRRDCARGAGACSSCRGEVCLSLGFRSADGHLTGLQPLSPSFLRRILTLAWASDNGSVFVTRGAALRRPRAASEPRRRSRSQPGPTSLCLSLRLRCLRCALEGQAEASVSRHASSEGRPGLSVEIC